MPRHFSPWGLVDRSATLSGELSLADTPRLRDAVVSIDELKYLIQAQRDLAGNPNLAVNINGQIKVTCERCLQEMPFTVDCSSTLVLKTPVQAATQSGEHELTDDCEVLAVETEERLDAFDLLQDEILLVLPLVVAHSDIQECGDKVIAVVGTEGSVTAASNESGETEPTTKPFAGLADLIGNAAGSKSN